MNVREAIVKGKQRAKEGRSRREKKFFSTPASPDKLIRLFNVEFKNRDYGKPLPLAKTTRNMMYGFIRLGRSNGWEDKEFYDTIRNLVKHWPRLKRKEIRSLKGKKVLLGDRPSLLEFFVARDSILSLLEKFQAEDRREEKPEKVKQVEVQPIRVKRHAPTEEEMQAEMERQMEEY